MKWILIIICSFPMYSIGQTSTIIYLVNEYCQGMESVNTDSLSKDELKIEIAKMAINIRNNNLDTIEKIKDILKKKYPNKQSWELQDSFIHSYLNIMVDSCEALFQVCNSMIPDCPEPNVALDTIVFRINEILDSNNHLSYREQVELIDSRIFEIVEPLNSFISTVYKDGYANPALMDDMVIYVLHNCPDYTKGFVLKYTLSSMEVYLRTPDK